LLPDAIATAERQRQWIELRRQGLSEIEIRYVPCPSSVEPRVFPWETIPFRQIALEIGEDFI
jgi:hypothetical protein